MLPRINLDWELGSRGVVSGRYNMSSPGIFQRLLVGPAEKGKQEFGDYSWQVDQYCAGWRRWNPAIRAGYAGTRDEAKEAAVTCLLSLVEDGKAECGCCIEDRRRREREKAWMEEQVRKMTERRSLEVFPGKCRECGGKRCDGHVQAVMAGMGGSRTAAAAAVKPTAKAAAAIAYQLRF